MTFFFENRAIYEIMPKNVVEPERTQTIWRLSVAYWISKATREQAHVRARTPKHTHARTQCSHPCAWAHTQICYSYLFPRQEWFRERVSVLRYT